MERLTARILACAANLPEGKFLSAKALLDLGSRAAIDQALSRLARRGRLARAGRGLYGRPIAGRSGKRIRSPEHVVRALAEAKGETVVPHGVVAANALGLTEQVPTRTIYLTSGRTRKLGVANQTVELRHAPNGQLVAGAKRRSGDIIRALAWLGPSEAKHSVTELSCRITKSEVDDMVAICPQLPQWLADSVLELRKKRETIARLARKYVWWTPSRKIVAEDIGTLVRNIMEMGTWEDSNQLMDAIGAQPFAAVLDAPPAGTVSAKSLAFWHHRLGRAGEPPRPSTRSF